jgi:hypothetical protein
MKHLMLSVLLLTGLGLAQQQIITVRGSEHPELIPDEAAAIAVFGVHSDQADIANTEKHHAKLQLSIRDHSTYDAAMLVFWRYPEERSKTYHNLLQQLSPDGEAKLKRIVQNEKVHMQHQIHPPPAEEDRGVFAAALEAAWTVYFAENVTVNDDNSIILTPQVSISGDDGGYCPAASGMFGVDTPSVMLHGNPWQIGPLFRSGGQLGGGDPVQFVYTFPDVILPADGTSVDLSFASHVEGNTTTPSVAAESPM